MDDVAPAGSERNAQDELESARFIAQASATLAQVGDYANTLERIAGIAVPTFSDWFGVHIRQPDGAIRRLAVRHRDPQMEARVEDLYKRYPPGVGRPYGAAQVLATGEPVWLPDFPAAIPSVARDETHAEMLAGLGLRSFICVPMRSHGHVMGTLTFATAESGRDFSDVHFRAAEDLAARAAIAIENSQLLEAMRDADRRKDEFLAMLAHELRNPLAPVRNAVQILRSKPLPPHAEWATGVLERQVALLARLVDDLLDVSRFTNGKVELRRQRVALSEVVHTAVEASRPAIDRGRHQLRVEVPVEPVHLDADPVRISQVLANLLNNAAKYTDHGGRITLVATREDGEAVIRVSDTGDGLAPELRERIFDMFVQGDQRADRTHGGLGIGLTLVKRLVELHGGSVSAKSDGPGHGSEFTVRLPALQAQPPGGALPARS